MTYLKDDDSASQYDLEFDRLVQQANEEIKRLLDEVEQIKLEYTKKPGASLPQPELSMEGAAPSAL